MGNCSWPFRELPQQESLVNHSVAEVDDQIQHKTSASSLLLWKDQTDKEENTVNNIGNRNKFIIHIPLLPSCRYSNSTPVFYRKPLQELRHAKWLW
jgi:hypothetical protein